MYFPPAGGGGVQRSLKLAQYLPALGIETHVLAPDDPKWVHRDPELRVPTQAWIHRARYLGPRARKPAEELRAADGLERALLQAQVTARRLLVPDASVTWNLTAIPGRDPDRASGGDRRGDHDLAARLGALRRCRGSEGDGRALARRPARPARREPAPARRHHRDARAAGGERAGRAARRSPRRRRLVRLGGDRGGGARPRRARSRARRSRTGATSTTSRGSSTRRRRASGSRTPAASSGKRDPRPFLQAFARLRASTRSRGSSATSARRDREWAESLGLGDRLELVPLRAARGVAAPAARLGGAAAARPRRRRARQGRALGQGVRVPRRRPADPRGRPTGRRGRRSSSARRAAGVVVAPDDVDGHQGRARGAARALRERRAPVRRAREARRGAALAPRASGGDGRRSSEPIV